MSFSADLEKFTRRARHRVEKTYRGTALAVLRGVVFRTPVGNPDIWQRPESAPPGYVGGRARGNWQTNLNGMTPADVDIIDASGGRAVSEGAAAIGRARVTDDIYLFNNVPYIGALEYGAHSRQAPAGMVRVTIAEFKRLAYGEARKP